MFLAFWRDCSLWCIRNCIHNDITSKMTCFFTNSTVHMSKTNHSPSPHKNLPTFPSHVPFIFLNQNCPAEYKNLFCYLRYIETNVTVNIWQSAKYFFVIKPTRCTNFTNVFCHQTLHVSCSSSVHHQEFIHCTLSFRAGPRWNCSSILVLLESCLQTYMTYTIAECIVNKLLMMDRRTVWNMQSFMTK